MWKPCTRPHVQVYLTDKPDMEGHLCFLKSVQGRWNRKKAVSVCPTSVQTRSSCDCSPVLVQLHVGQWLQPPLPTPCHFLHIIVCPELAMSRTCPT